MTHVCSLGTVLALLGAGLYLLSPQQHAPVHDVGPLARVDSSPVLLSRPR
jgi:hypothetical protein